MGATLKLDKLKSIRNKLGISQEEMAKKLGYSSKSGYNMLENSNTNISLEKAKKISEIFNMDIEEIFF